MKHSYSIPPPHHLLQRNVFPSHPMLMLNTIKRSIFSVHPVIILQVKKKKEVDISCQMQVVCVSSLPECFMWLQTNLSELSCYLIIWFTPIATWESLWEMQGQLRQNADMHAGSYGTMMLFDGFRQRKYYSFSFPRFSQLRVTRSPLWSYGCDLCASPIKPSKNEPVHTTVSVSW